MEFPEKDMMYAKGIAHLSFAGGGIFLPARSAYDRQHLIENVTHTAAQHGRVQILVDDQRWLVQPDVGGRTPSCVDCGALAQPPCRAGDGGGAHCVRCALGTNGPPPTQHELYKDVERHRLLVPRVTFGLA